MILSINQGVCAKSYSVFTWVHTLLKTGHPDATKTHQFLSNKYCNKTVNTFLNHVQISVYHKPSYQIFTADYIPDYMSARHLCRE